MEEKKTIPYYNQQTKEKTYLANPIWNIPENTLYCNKLTKCCTNPMLLYPTLMTTQSWLNNIGQVCP
jgi:hypothetical protein